VTTFDLITDERERLADMFAALTGDQWRTQSLCDAWTVHDIAAHLLMPLVTPMPRFMLEVLRNRMSFNRANVTMTADVSKRSNAQIVTQLREKAGSHFTPPGSGPAAPLTDALVHGQDARRPLGIPWAFAPDRLMIVLGYLTGGKARGFVPGSRVEGLSYRADDIDWSAGEGPEVVGRAEAIMMAVAGRSVALPELTGPGAAVLSRRLAQG
jgi:uncharacterized protein (TIGR03083 family)